MVQEMCRASELRSLDWPKGTFVWALWNQTRDKCEGLGKRGMDGYKMKEMEEMLRRMVNRGYHIAQELVS